MLLDNLERMLNLNIQGDNINVSEHSDSMGSFIWVTFENEANETKIKEFLKPISGLSDFIYEVRG